jgi:hypothetical protein
MGAISTFPPSFVQSLLELPKEQQDTLVQSLRRHTSTTERQLTAKRTEWTAIKAEYDAAAGGRLGDETLYHNAASALQAAPSSGRTLALYHHAQALGAYQRSTTAFGDVVAKIQEFKKGFEALGALVKPCATKPQEFIRKFLSQWGATELPLQAPLNVTALELHGSLTDGNGAFSSIETLNTARKTALQAFARLRALPPLKDPSKMAQQMARAGMTELASRGLRLLCKDLAETDLEKIFGKVGTDARKAFSALLEESTRDSVELPSLVGLLGTRPQVVRALVTELEGRTTSSTPLILSDANQGTLDALTLAVGGSDRVLGDELMRLGAGPLAELLIVHLNDEDATSSILVQLPLKQLAIGLTRGAEDGTWLTGKTLRRLMTDAADSTQAVWALKEAQDQLSQAFVLKIPKSAYAHLAIGHILAQTLPAVCVESAALGALSHYMEWPLYSALTPFVPYVWKLDPLQKAKDLADRVMTHVSKSVPALNELKRQTLPAVCVETAALMALTSYMDWPLSLSFLPWIPRIRQLHPLQKTRDFASRVTAWSSWLQGKKVSTVTKAPLPTVELPKEEPPEEGPLFHYTPLPTLFEATQPEDASSVAGKVHRGIETIFSPVTRFVGAANARAEALLGSEEEQDLMIRRLCAEWGIDLPQVATCGTMMGHLEAFFNWGGRLPVVCSFTGAWRVTVGLVIAATSSLFGLGMIIASKKEESREAGRWILRAVALKHGGGNIVSGVFESASWAISLLSHLPKDLMGLRWQYAGESPSSFQLTRVIQETFEDVKQKIA